MFCVYTHSTRWSNNPKVVQRQFTDLKSPDVVGPPEWRSPRYQNFCAKAHSKQWPDSYQAVQRQFMDLIVNLVQVVTFFNATSLTSGCEIHFASND